MSTATASAALETIDLGSSELDYDAVLRAASNIHPMLRAAFMAEQMAGLEGDAGGFGFGADDFGKRAFDANNAGRKAGLIGNDIEEQEREEEEARLDDFKSSMEAYLADWRISTHTIGGYNFTGAELEEIEENLQDPAFREKNKAYLKQKYGWSDAQIDQMNDQAQAGIAAMKKPESQRTEAEKEAIQTMNSNPNMGDYLKGTQEFSNTSRAELNNNNHNSSDQHLRNDTSFAQRVSGGGQNAFSTRSEFTNSAFASQSNTFDQPQIVAKPVLGLNV